MRLYGTPPSHFTRKVRVLLQELAVPYEFVQLDKILEVGPQHFGNNPLHMFPVLEHEGQTYFESDLICEHLMGRFGKGLLKNGPRNMLDQQRIAVMNGGMSAGVTLVRAKRSGIENWNDYAYFRQELAAIPAALAWLEKDLIARGVANDLTMVDITLMCFAQWAEFREFLKDWKPYPALEKFVHVLEKRPSFANTHPSLATVKQ